MAKVWGSSLSFYVVDVSVVGLSYDPDTPGHLPYPLLGRRRATDDRNTLNPQPLEQLELRGLVLQQPLVGNRRQVGRASVVP